jgi:hypothetical protein
MVIDQRNAGASVTPTDAYTLDRWFSNTSVASKFSVQQNAGSVTPPAGFTKYLGVTSLSAYTVGSSEFFLQTQYIEGFNIADLAWGTASASPVTLSFWVRSSLTGTFGGALNNNGNSRSYPYSYTISSANTWEYKTITITGDTTGTWATDTNRGIAVRFGLGVGSTNSGTAGSWSGSAYYSATGATSVVGTNGATFYITGVQLEAGTTASPFEYRQYGTELALCQRYFFAWNAQGSSTAVVPATNEVDLICWFPVTMRAIPTTTNNATAGSGSGVTGINPYIGGNLATRAGTTLTTNANSTQHAQLYSTAFTATVGQAGNWNFNSGVYIYMSAEL